MRILILDDNKPLVETIAVFLAEKNIQYKMALNGKDGLDAIMNEKFDFILMDLNMPGLSGFDIYSTLKKQNLLKYTNIIIMTGQRLFDKDIREMMYVGVRRIMKKPFSLTELYDEIKHLSIVRLPQS